MYSVLTTQLLLDYNFCSDLSLLTSNPWPLTSDLSTLQVTGAKIVVKECRLLSLSQDIIDRWKGEMEIIKRLDHLNIVRALNIPAGLDPMNVGDTPCICMEYCDGGDLRQVCMWGDD